MNAVVGNPYNPLTSFGVLVVSLVFALVPYLFTVAVYGTFNFEKWHVADASLSIMVFIVLAVFGLCFYFVREKNFDIDEWALRCIDVSELSRKRYLDYLLTHYGYVASAATFCAAVVYISKGMLPMLGITAVSLFMSVTVCAVFLVYGLVFLKAVWGVRDRPWPAFMMLLPMIVLDATLMQMAIKGAAGLQ